MLFPTLTGAGASEAPARHARPETFPRRKPRSGSALISRNVSTANYTSTVATERSRTDAATETIRRRRVTSLSQRSVFERSVFINCPFHDAYLPMLRPILFVVILAGMIPRIASERLNAGEDRLEKIVELIEASKFGIHDLSRMKANKVGELFRLNMPLELGLDLGCRRFKPGAAQKKQLLVLETERYRYQAAISDLANVDIESHSDDPVIGMTAVSNWLEIAAGLDLLGPSALWGEFTEFMGDNYDRLKARGHSDRDIELQPVAQLMAAMRTWHAEDRV